MHLPYRDCCNFSVLIAFMVTTDFIEPSTFSAIQCKVCAVTNSAREEPVVLPEGAECSESRCFQ